MQENPLTYNTLELLTEFKKLCNNFGNNIETVSMEALGCIQKICSIGEAAIFLKVPDNLDFKLFKYIGKKDEENWQNTFQKLLHEGSIGILLATCSITNSNLSEKHYVIAPLFGNKDFFGFIIVETDIEELKDVALTGELISFISCYLSHKITNVQLNNKIIELEQNMNLHIASRTITLVKNNQQLADKIRGLYKNLSMSLPHEFRTPLNQILGNSDFLLKHFEMTEPGEAKEIISDIHISCRRLQTLLEHYLVMSQLELIAINIDQLEEIRSAKTHSIETSIYNVLSSKSDYDIRYQDFKLDIEDASVQISENFFIIMMTELIDNAIKYSDAGKPIIISTKRDNDNLILTVMDHGSGINNEDLTKIDAYTQFERNKFEQQGLGLGLAIVFRIVDISNSKIKIESEINNFTKIMINIPLAKN